MILRPLLAAGIGRLPQPGRFPVTDCSGTPLHRLGFCQVFIVDHRLQCCTGALFGRCDHRIALTERREHLDRQSFDASVPFGSLATSPCLNL
jgi:hypothetical protein